MRDYTLARLSDSSLLRDLAALVALERESTAMLVAHLAEVDARRLYVPAGYPSMFAYCVEELHFSEDAAYRRIRAARAARQFPAIFGALADGRINLAAVCLLAPHLTKANVEELVETATHRRKAEIEELLARRFPDSGIGAAARGVVTIRPIPQVVPGRVGGAELPLGQFGMSEVSGTPDELTTMLPPDGLGASLAAPGIGPASASPELPIAASNGSPLDSANYDQLVPGRAPGQLVPGRLPASQDQLVPGRVATERFLVKLTINKSAYDKLNYAQALLSHTVPAGDVAQVLERALDVLIAQLERKKLGASRRQPPAPRASADPPAERPAGLDARQRPAVQDASRPRSPVPTLVTRPIPKRYIPARVRRAIWERDKGQCTFVSAGGHRCTARRFLEFDHIQPVARGGRATVEGIRLRCRAHNQYEAERAFGTGFMERKRHEARLANGRGAEVPPGLGQRNGSSQGNGSDERAHPGNGSDERARTPENQSGHAGGSIQER